MKITYVFHSCFVMEFDRCIVMVDFRKGDLAEQVKNELLQSAKPVYVLCSHSHSDHFDREILTWQGLKSDIRYIFSDELLASGLVKAEEAVFLKKTDRFEDDYISVQAFGSTDIGCSFLIGCEGLVVFHAGDLNNWHWYEEVPKAEALTYENNYLCELELLAEQTDHLHLAMFPVDPRLGKEYMRGAGQFVARIHTDYFLPMHFWEDYERANAFADIAQQEGCTFLELTHQGQSYNI